MQVRIPPGTFQGMQIQVISPYGQTLQCPVPAGMGPGGIFRMHYPIPTSVPRLIDEEQKFAQQPCNAHVLPTYWTHVRHGEGIAFDQMMYVDSEHYATFDELLAGTYRAKATQDRPCPKSSCPCPRTAGGCPCVQADGDPGLPVAYRVRRVVRVEDSQMWGRYCTKRSAIQSKRMSEMPLASLDPPAKTDEIARSRTALFDPLDIELNEVYLWHGTRVRTALAIAQDDFKIDFAARMMYGAGAYLAEHSTKADEYAHDEPGGYYEDVYALLLCRVCLGKFYYTADKDENAATLVNNGLFDSCCGDRIKSANTFREFVCYDPDQVYPEYVVLYNRQHRHDDPESINAMIATPFHMQLPVYWTNVALDPRTNPFHDQYKVRKSTLAILDRLVQASFHAEGQEVSLEGARRIENSNVWNSYVQSKQELWPLIRGTRSSGSLPSPSPKNNKRAFVPANELDGDASSGHVLTHVHLQGESMEEAISVATLEAPLNEFLCWHGTSRGAAEAIVRNDFTIPIDNQPSLHGKRFGPGAYFAEELEKSLGYAKEENGIKCVLLCRILCGDIYYTEEKVDLDADMKRQSAGKHSILANPEKVGPREFIIKSAAQVYPEFILELKVVGGPPASALPSTPSPQILPAPAPPSAPSRQVQVSVPPCAGPGAVIECKVPDGTTVKITLPHGVMPGQTISVAY